MTVDLISNRDKSEMKDVVRDHLADNEGEAVPALLTMPSPTASRVLVAPKRSPTAVAL